MRLSLSVFLLLALSACGALNAADVPATLRAENTAYMVEATTIANTFQTEQAAVQATAQVVGTVVAQSDSINRQLVATARAVIPPTPGRQIGSAPVDGASGVIITAVGNDPSAVGGAPPNVAAATPGASAATTPQFVNTGVTTHKRDSDGCADGFETQIPQNVSQIYVITRAVSVRAGTVMDVEWHNNGQIVGQGSWTVPRDESNFCIWFYLDTTSVALTPGAWSVLLMADKQPIGAEVPFTVVEASSGG